jgi:competence protein ComEC
VILSRLVHGWRVLLAGMVCAAACATAECRAQWLFGQSSPKQVAVEVLDVGQGDSILIRSPEGKTALVDAGPTRNGALSVLRQHGIKSIDLLVLSHHHSDHYGGMDAIVKAYKPHYFLVSKSGHATTLYLKLLKTIESEGTTMIVPSAQTRKLELGSVEILIFPQPPDDRRDENNNSIGLRLTYGAFSLLLTGDSEAPERRWWLEHHPELVRNCTILKLPHHGSRTGTDALWLKEVRPALTVASLGVSNEYGHPHAETLTLLKRGGIPLLRTDQLGTITITSDGRNWQVTEPAPLARKHPNQNDVDRVAASLARDEPTTSAARTRAR